MQNKLEKNESPSNNVSTTNRWRNREKIPLSVSFSFVLYSKTSKAIFYRYDSENLHQCFRYISSIKCMWTTCFIHLYIGILR